MIGNFYDCGYEYYYCFKSNIALIIDVGTLEIEMKENIEEDFWDSLIPTDLNEVEDYYKDIINDYITGRNL